MLSRSIHAVIPVKGGVNAKQRLAGFLSEQARRELVSAMLEDVLAAARGVPSIARIVVVTADREIEALARSMGAAIVLEATENGHSAAVAAVARTLRENADTLLTIPGDVPLVTAAELSRLVQAHQGDPAFTIVPSRDLRGSNAVICTPPSAVPFAFGSDSFYPHLDAAIVRGLLPRILMSELIGLDIDEPEDIKAFLMVDSACKARAVLQRWAQPTQTVARGEVRV